MTVHLGHSHPIAGKRRDASPPPVTRGGLSRWALPLAAVGIGVVAGLLYLGVLPATLLIFGAAAGCGLIHVFIGHGGHGVGTRS